MLCQYIASPTNLQLQSPFVRLPAEIQHMICGFALTADDPIVDPRANPLSSPLDSEVRPPLGIALLQTCRRLYYEVDRRPLFAQNTFRFTTLDRMQLFLKQLDTTGDIQDVEIDFRRLDADQPYIARGWLRMFSRLSEEAPNLKCLRLNFDSWPRLPMFRTSLWIFLRDILAQIKDLGIERIIVIGASKGSGMARRVPWSPVHFVGGDDVGLNDLVPRMKNVVAGTDHSKIIRWVRDNGKLQLEVISLKHLFSSVDPDWNGPSPRQSSTGLWPASGSCTVSGYENRFAVTDSLEKVNPNAAV